MNEDALAYQDAALQGVSRTFALTIPVLPAGLREVVGNAYLLCRIADTIEDDPDLSFADKRAFSERFVAVVEGREDAPSFARGLRGRISPEATVAEKDLVAHAPVVIGLTHGFNPAQRAALTRCIRIMADGMVHYQGQETLDGLPDQAAMDRYCYYVAGVVGEMLTELFCDYSPEIAQRRAELMPLAVSFGQGLQMTNILKDIWEDRTRGACWLPRDLFEARGLRLSEILPGEWRPAYTDGIGHLVGVTHGHLRRALAYTLLLPPREVGIRKFCLWALGMAVLTLRRINAQRSFSRGEEVKISRRCVRGTILATSAAADLDGVLRVFFDLASRGLPYVAVS
jgi:farnesyl-diphosphate farnesyltransferase